jgi:hypothetical protein
MKYYVRMLSGLSGTAFRSLKMGRICDYLCDNQIPNKDSAQ